MLALVYITLSSRMGLKTGGPVSVHTLHCTPHNIRGYIFLEDDDKTEIFVSILSLQLVILQSGDQTV